MEPTARTNRNTISAVWRRACSWRSKKSMALETPGEMLALRERDFHRLALFRRLGRLEKRRLPELAETGDEVVREALDRGVVAHHRVVVGLARERDLVLRAGQLFRDL